MSRALPFVPRLAVLSSALLLAGCLDTHSRGSESLFVVFEGENGSEKLGFINREGKSVINPQFDDVGWAAFFRFRWEGAREGLIRVEVGDKWGFIDTMGQFVINPQFSDVREFSGGLAAVKVGDKWGFIDRQRHLVIRLQFNHALSFSDGRAAVKVGDKWGYVDKQGGLVSHLEFDKALGFSEGLARVKVGDKWGFIGRKGQYVANPQFNDARDYAAGRAAVKVGDKWGFIGRKGTLVSQLQFDEAKDFSEDLAAVKVGDKWGFIDRKGTFVINLQFDEALSFSEGLVGVKVGDKWGYIDRKGSFVVNPQFDDALSFSEGRAAVELGDKWGFIDRKGTFVINLQFDDASSFSGGLVWVADEDHDTLTLRYINRSGHEVWASGPSDSAGSDSTSSSIDNPASGSSNSDRPGAGDRAAASRQTSPGSGQAKPQPGVGVAGEQAVRGQGFGQQEIDIPDRFREPYELAIQGKPFEFTEANMLFMSGAGSALMNTCKVKLKTADATTLALFVRSGTVLAALGNTYSNPNVSRTISGQIIFTTGEKLVESLGCSSTEAKLLTKGILKAIESNSSGKNGGASKFVSTCSSYYSVSQCECLARIGRAVYPNIHQMTYHREIIAGIIRGNPFVALQIPMACGINNY